MINLFKMLLFNHQAYQKRKFIFFKFQEESIKKLKDKQNNLHINTYYQSLSLPMSTTNVSLHLKYSMVFLGHMMRKR